MSDAFITPEATLLYNHLFTPWAHPSYKDSEPKYTAMLLLDPQDPGCKHLLDEHARLIKDNWPKGIPKLDFSNCIIKATDRFEDHPEWEGLIILNTSKKPDFGIPKVLLGPQALIEEPTDIYPGVRVRAHINLWTFARGIAVELHAIMKVSDAEPIALGNTPDSAAAFKDYAPKEDAVQPADYAPDDGEVNSFY